MFEVVDFVRWCVRSYSGSVGAGWIAWYGESREVIYTGFRDDVGVFCEDGAFLGGRYDFVSR